MPSTTRGWPPLAATSIPDDPPPTAADRRRRASVCAGVAYHPLYGKPVDPRLTSAFELQTEALGRAMALLDRPAAALTIAFDGHRLPAFFFPARACRLIYHLGININKGLNEGDRERMAADPSWRDS